MICLVCASAFCWNLLMAGLLTGRTAPGLRCFLQSAPAPLRPVPHNVTILSQSKTKRKRRRIAGTASCGGESDAPHNPVAVRRTDRACRWLGVGAKRHPAQPDPVRPGRPARAHRDAADRACDGRPARQGRQFQELALAVSDLHHGERLGDGQRPLPRRYRHLQQHHLHRPPHRPLQQHRDAVPRGQSRAPRGRRAFRRRLHERRIS